MSDIFASYFQDQRRIYRYMDFSKFVWIVQNKKLFFPAAAYLPDRSEGLTASARDKATARLLGRYNPEKHGELERNLEEQNESQEKIKHYVFVTCWNMSENESYGMWKSYLSSDEGVGVVSTVGSLKEALKGQSAHIETVSYSKRPEMKPLHLGPFFRKTPQFEFEKELRAVIDYYPKTDSPSFDIKSILAKKGIEVEIDLQQLVLEVRISPKSPIWFRETVAQFLEFHKLNVKCNPSELTDQLR